MAKELATSLSLSINANYTNDSDLTGGNDIVAQITKSISDTLATGTGVDQADRIYAATRSLNATTTEDLDLAGSLTDAFGATLTFARVKALLIKLNTDTAGYTLKVGGDASAAASTFFDNATDKLIVRGGGFALLWAPDVTGYAITGTTADLLQIENPNAGTVTYDIIIIGCSA